MKGGWNLSVFLGVLTAIWLCSCSPKIFVRGDIGAGGFASGFERQSDSHAERQVRLFRENTEVAVLVPAIKHAGLPVADTSKKPGSQNILNGRFPIIDKLPPASSMNGADSLLLSAQKDFIRAERISSRTPLKKLIILILGITVAGWVFYQIQSKEVFNDPNTGWLAIFVILFYLLLYWLLLGLLYLYINFKDKIRRRLGISKIMRAPRKAPPSRRIEYEVRSLLMLNNFMPRRIQLKKIGIIRDLSQTDKYNPWLGRLKELKYYKESLQMP